LSYIEDNAYLKYGGGEYVEEVVLLKERGKNVKKP